MSLDHLTEKLLDAAKYTDDLRKDRCTCGQCSEFEMVQRCHPEAGFSVIYHYESECIALNCKECLAAIEIIRVASNPKSPSPISMN